MSAALPSSTLSRWLGRLALLGFAVVALGPIWIALKTALTPATGLFEGAHEFLPRDATWFNFQRVLGLVDAADPRLARHESVEMNFSRALLNSTIFTTLVVVPQIFCSALAAYAFARLEFPGRRLLFFLFISASMIPAAVLFIPNFILVRQLGLLNTYLGMAAPFALMTPFAVFYLRQVFLGTPRDIEEAARIDGASVPAIFLRIVLPMHQAPLATLAILTSISAWNEFFWPFLVGRDISVQTMAVALNTFRAQQPEGSPDWTGLMACAILGLLPMLILLFVLGRKVVESLQYSGGR